MVVFAKDGIEVRNFLGAKPPLVELSEPVYELEIHGELEVQKKQRGYQPGETSWLGRPRHKSPGERSAMQFI